MKKDLNDIYIYLSKVPKTKTIELKGVECSHTMGMRNCLRQKDQFCVLKGICKLTLKEMN